MWSKEDRIERSKINNKIYEVSKPDRCLLCGKKCSSFCNSHTVPRFILKNIAENGKVAYGAFLDMSIVDTEDDTRGINNAFTFRLVCRECDKKEFSAYESMDKILKFSELSIAEKKEILIEISIKSHLSHISSKEMLLNCKKIITSDIFIKPNWNIPNAYTVDILEHKNSIKKLKSYRNKNNFPFIVLMDELLDYKVKISTQTIINYVIDTNGEIIFNVHDYSINNKATYFNLVIFPVGDKTRVLFYIEKSIAYKVQQIIDFFNKLSLDDKLNFLFVTLILYDEQFFITPSYKKIIDNDKTITDLFNSANLEKGDRLAFFELKNFKKYRNYLSKKNNLDN